MGLLFELSYSDPISKRQKSTLAQVHLGLKMSLREYNFTANNINQKPSIIKTNLIMASGK